MEHLGVNALFLIPGEVGGSQTYIVETLRALLPMLRCRCTVFTNSDCDAFLRDALGKTQAPCGLAFDNLGFSARNRFSRIIREQIQLPRHVASAGCDLLWSPGYTAPLLCRNRQAVSILDMQYRRFREDLSPLAWLATHILVTFGSRRCGRIITLSNFAKGEIAALAGVPASKISVTPLGVGGMPEAPTALERGASAAPYILSVAASYPHKNLPALVAAFDSIADSIPHRLVLAGGRGRGEGELRRAISSAGHSRRIERLEWLEPAALGRLYIGADLFAMPSRYEGFGIPVIEAQRAGVPVVATRAASLPEVCGDGAVFADGEDAASLAAAISRALALTPTGREALVARGRANASRFTWGRTAEATLEALDGAMKPAGCSSGEHTGGKHEDNDK